MSNNKQSSNHIPDVGKKVSSVEWLEREIQKSLIPAQKDYFKWAFEQAKAMHKNEVTEAFYIGRYEYNNFDSSSTEYYNETYGGNK